MTAVGKWNNQIINVIDIDCAMQDQSRQEFTDAINHCLDLLRENNYITDINMDVISRRSAIVGQEIYEYLKQMITKEINLKSTTAKLDNNNKKSPTNIQSVHCENPLTNFIKEEPIEIIDTEQPESFIEPKLTYSKTKRKMRSKLSRKMDLSDESDWRANSDDPCSTTTTTATTTKSSCRKRGYSLIPLDVKSKVINIAHSNPTWGLKELRKYGCKKLTSMNTLRKWKLHVKSGGTKLDKLNMINCMTYTKYNEACDNNQLVTTPMIREWAMKAAEQFFDGQFKFEASQSWINKFKAQHGIPPDDIIESDKKFLL